jgi:heme exporter protein CcmD
MLEQLAFGKYGWFVWPAIAVFVTVIGGLVVQSLLAERRIRRDLDRLQRADER